MYTAPSEHYLPQGKCCICLCYYNCLFSYFHMSKLQGGEGGWLCSCLWQCQTPSTLFSKGILLVSTAEWKQERSFRKKLCPAFSVLSLRHAQWAGGTVAHSRPHKKASIHSSYNFSTGMFVWGVAVGFSQNEISGQPNGCLWTRCRRNQVPDVKPTAPPPIVTTHFSGQKKSTI